MPTEKKPAKREKRLLQQIDELQLRLAEAEETLRAIREGEVDAVIVSGTKGEQVFSLVGTDSIYRLIVETMKEAAFTVTLDGTILFCNTRFGEFVKRPLEQVVGHRLQEFVAGDNRGSASSLLISVQQQPVRQRLVFQATDGTAVPAHVSANVLNQPDGLSICVVASDLTELENSTELIQQLRRQQEALQAVNEELASTEEELRAQNDELTTSRTELDRARARYQDLFEAAPDGYIVTDAEGTIQEVNQAAARLLGSPAAHLKGNPISALLPAARKERYLELLAALNAGATPLPDWEVEIRPLEGPWFWAAVSAAASCDEEGRIVGLRWLIRDVTERKRVEEERERRSANMNSLLAVGLDVLAAESVPDLLDRVADAARVITRARYAISGFGYGAGRRTFGFTSLSGSYPLSGAGSDFKIEDSGSYLDLIGGRSSLRLTGEELRGHPRWGALVDGDGPHRGLLGAVLLGRDGKAQGLILVRDRQDGEFTEEDELILRQLANLSSVAVQHLQAREALAKSRDELEVRVRERTAELEVSANRMRDLSAKLLAIQEEERRRMALEIHDGLSSVLSATKYRVDRILAGEGDRPSWEEVAALLRRTVEDSRRLQMALRPSVLDDLGILVALNWLTRETVQAYPHLQVEKRYGVAETDIPESLKTIIFRVSQEAVNNIAKHSMANLVNLSLQNVGGRIELSVQDNGHGFDPEEASARMEKGLGLLSMRERTELSGGSFHIESAAGKGTTIRASWPENPATPRQPDPGRV
ncbi:MAG: PAS domain S-box protein [bacterium]